MRLSSYLPSSQFSLIVVSIVLAGVLVFGAQYITKPHAFESQITSANQPAPVDDWQTQLDAIQATAPQLPDTPSAATQQQLLDAAKTNNITDTVARSLLIKLTSANSQGLGADIPTQDKLTDEANSMV